MSGMQETGGSDAAHGGEWTRAGWIAWSACGICTIIALLFVRSFGDDIPAFDGGGLGLPLFTGHRRISLGWLWEQYYDFRLPLPRLALWIIAVSSGARFTAVGFFNVFSLALSATLLMLSARAIRGRQSIADAFFPLVLLRLGQYETYFVSYTVATALWTVLMSAVLLAISRRRAKGDGFADLLAGVPIVLLPLTGSFGLAVLPPLALWLFWTGYVRCRQDDGSFVPGRGTTAFATALAASAVGILYMTGFRLPPAYAPSPGPGAVARTISEYAAACLGAPGIQLWPFSAAVVAGLWALATASSVHAFLRRPEDRVRAAGFLAFGFALAMHAAALGFGRAGGGAGSGFSTRYMTHGAVLLCFFFLAMELARNAEAARTARMLLAISALVTFPFDAGVGIANARVRHGKMNRLAGDAAAGMPVADLAARHWPLFAYSEPEAFTDLSMLREAGIGPFRIVNRENPARPPSTPPGKPLRLFIHGCRIRAVAFSPDGGALVTAGDDGTVRIWIIESGLPRAVCAGHRGPVTAAAFSPDGRVLATGGWDGTTREWNPAVGRQKAEQQHGSAIGALAFSPTGGSMAIGLASGLVEIWNTGVGKKTAVLAYHDGEVRTAAFSPDGSLLASAGWAGNARVAVWNASSGKMSREIGGHQATISAVVFSPNGSSLASASYDSMVILASIDGTETNLAFRGHASPVSAVVFMPNGRMLASADWAGSVRFWDQDNPDWSMKLDVCSAPVSALAVSPDGRFLATGGWDGKALVWRIPAGLPAAQTGAGPRNRPHAP